MPAKSMDPDLDNGGRPSRSAYWFSQVVKSLLYICLVLFVLLLALAWIVFITFTVAPIIVWKRGYRKVLEYYTAPFELQTELFRSYRDALRHGASEWDFEKGKPEPIALQPRGFKSQEEVMPLQTKSNLLLKLPVELRLQIYKEAITGGSPHVIVSVHRRLKKGEQRSECTVHGYFGRRTVTEVPVLNCKCFDLPRNGIRHLHPHGDRPLPCDVTPLRSPGKGILALPKTCRQVYAETIELIYTLPIFHFDYPTHPPFFLQSILPCRLALIKRIEICITQTLMRSPCTKHDRPSRRWRHRHDLQQCARCNIDRWLKIIRRNMANLERIDAHVYIDVEMPPISMDESWITHLFKLQHGYKGRRDLRIFTHPIAVDYMPPESPQTAVVHPSTAEAGHIDRSLQDRIEWGTKHGGYEIPASEVDV